jgi:uncharacterized membrane protein
VLLLHRPDQLADGSVIEARSNLSMSLDGLTAVFVGLCAVSLLVVAWPVFLGLWPVLLAALVHLAVVGWCFRAAWRGNWARERLRLDGDELVVEQFRLGRQSRRRWPAAWTRVELLAGRFGELRVFIASQGQRQEIGAFLPQTEREELAGMVKGLLRSTQPGMDRKPYGCLEG